MLNEITPLILTYNEAPNIRRTLEQLRWARRIVVVDSFSSDETCELASQFAQVEIVQRKFDTFAAQCNFGLEQIRTDWVLSMDADYVLTDELVHEIQELAPAPDMAGYSIAFRYCIRGRPLRGTLYPPRTALYRKSAARYHDEGHGHRVTIQGNTRALAGRIDHDDRKPLDRWLREQEKYAKIEAAHLLATPASQLKLQDRIRRKIVLAPALVLGYTLFGKGLILDGWPGWYYGFQRAYAELLLSLRLLESRLNPGD